MAEREKTPTHGPEQIKRAERYRERIVQTVVREMRGKSEPSRKMIMHGMLKRLGLSEEMQADLTRRISALLTNS